MFYIKRINLDFYSYMRYTVKITLSNLALFSNQDHRKAFYMYSSFRSTSRRSASPPRTQCSRSSTRRMLQRSFALDSSAQRPRQHGCLCHYSALEHSRHLALGRDTSHLTSHHRPWKKALPCHVRCDRRPRRRRTPRRSPGRNHRTERKTRRLPCAPDE